MTLSVIVPVYNTAKYLDECVQSILDQTFTDFEIILVDDGSTDNSGKMCDEWARKDNRIKVVHQQNQGLSGARNTGLLNSSGEYVSFVDSDDMILSNMFQLLMGHITNDSLDAVWGTCYRFFDDDVNNRSIRNIKNLSCFSQKEILNNMVLQIIFGNDPGFEVPGTMWGCIYKKSIITENKLIVTPVSETSSEDNHFNIRFLQHCTRVKWVNEPVCLYRKNVASLSNNIKPYTVPSFKNFENQVLQMGKEWDVDQNELALRCKKRTILSFSVIAKIIINTNNYSKAKETIYKYIKDNNIDISFKISELKNTQLQVVLFWVLLKLKMFLPLFCLVKVYSKFVVK